MSATGPPVPGMAYHYHSHLISLTAVPASGYANSAAAQRVNVLCRTEDGVAYWALGDIEAAVDLENFA
jgi:hypothetical protein